MPKRRKESTAPPGRAHRVIEGAGSVVRQPIVETL